MPNETKPKSKAAVQAKGCGCLLVIAAGIAVWAANQPSEPKKSAEEIQRGLDKLKIWYVAPTPGGRDMIVWRDQVAMEKGLAFISTGEALPHLQKVLGLINCFVAPGTKVISIFPGFSTSEISVVEGPSDGCEGVADNSSLTHVEPKPRTRAPTSHP